MENSRNVSVGDLIYGSDAYYGQVTRIGASVVEFTTVGLMPQGPQGDQGLQGPIGLTGPQGEQGIPGEVQIKDLPGYNLSGPDLSTATDLGDGNYRIYNDNGVTIDYNVNSGIYTRSGTATAGIFMRLSDRILDYHNQIMTMKVVRVSGTGEVYPFIGTGTNFGANMTINMNEATVTKLLDNPIGGRIELYNSLGISANVQFKLQLEEGVQATPHTVPGQIPQYNEQFAVRPQQAWITPTLLNSATGTLQYMKDSLGFVHFRGNVKMPIGASTSFMTMPVGYRVNENYTVPVWDNVKRIVGSILIIPSGACYLGSGVDGSESNGTIMHITYQGA